MTDMGEGGTDADEWMNVSKESRFFIIHIKIFIKGNPPESLKQV